MIFPELDSISEMSTRGNTVEARRQGQESLTIFEANGNIKAVEVRQWLAGFP